MRQQLSKIKNNLRVTVLDIIYARQSVDKKDSISIEGQIDLCRRECSGEPMVFQDKGFSGKNIDRPAFKQLMQAVERGEVGRVVVYRLDRISRSITDFGRVWDILNEHNVEFISVNEKFDTSTPVGRAMIYIIMVFAQLERETISERLLDSYKFRSQQGVFMGGNTPFGYTSKQVSLDGKQVSILELDADKQQAVKDIFNFYLFGYNTWQIAHKLNDLKIKPRSGKTWTSTGVIRILKNISYCQNDYDLYDYLISRQYRVINPESDFDGNHGMCCFFKNAQKNKATEVAEQVVCVGLHDPIIECKSWIDVQNRINAVKETPNQSKSSAKSWLAGLIKCGDCGHSFGLKSTQKGGKEYSYYYCRGRSARGASTCQNDLWIKADILEDAVINKVTSRLEYLLEKTELIPHPVVSAEAVVLKKQLAETQQQINNLIDNIGKGNSIVDGIITERITKLQGQLNQTTGRIVALDAGEYSGRKLGEQQLLELKSKLHDFGTFGILEKNKIIQSYVDKIVVSNNGAIEVYFNL
jgi:DNA invertase Pin-like site-specific DNA recombinase